MKNNRYQILLFFTIFIWGSSYVANRSLLTHIPPFLIMLINQVSGSLILIAASKKMRLPKIERQDYKKIFLIGFWGYFLAGATVTLSIQYTNASVASLINSMNPIFIIIMARLFLGEKLNLRKIAAIVIAMAGVFVIIGVPQGGAGIVGVLFGISNLFMWSLTVIFIKKLSEKYNPLSITAYGMGVAALFSLPSSLIYMSFTKAPVIWYGNDVLSLIYLCLVCTALSQVMWSLCLSKLPVVKCASFYPVQPMSAMLLGVFLLGEPVTFTLLIGSALIILSILMNP